MRVYGLICVVCVLAVAGCARYSASGQVYPRYDTRTAYDVEYGEVLGVREVEIEGYSTVIGRWGGAIVGEAIGSTTAIIQASDVVFAPGDPGRVLFGPEGSARVTPP